MSDSSPFLKIAVDLDVLNAVGNSDVLTDLLKISASGADNRFIVCFKKKFGMPSGPPFLLRSNLEIVFSTSYGVIFSGFAVFGFAVCVVSMLNVRFGTLGLYIDLKNVANNSQTSLGDDVETFPNLNFDG